MQEPFLIEDLAVSAIGIRYAELRIVKPRADGAMKRSIKQYGQILPVVCVTSGAGLEIIDGFKRLRAYQCLGRTTLSALAFSEMPAPACKAALLKRNQSGKSITDLEEAVVIHSLCHDDGLNLTEISVLLEQDKSWINRRVSLLEKHHEEVLKSIMLGLLPMASGRQLARLPRGNQEAALACVIKHRPSTRETAKLVSYLLSRPGWDYQTILDSPWEILDLGPKRPQSILSRPPRDTDI